MKKRKKVVKEVFDTKTISCPKCSHPMYSYRMGEVQSLLSKVNFTVWQDKKSKVYSWTQK